MNASGYRTMKDLLQHIRENLDQLENGQLQASQLDPLVNDSRELFERLVVLRYKALEKDLLPPSASEKQKQQEEKAIQGFKLNLASGFTPPATPAEEPKPVEAAPNQIDLLQAIKEASAEEKAAAKAEPDVPALKEDPLATAAPASLNDKLSASHPPRVTLAEKLQKKPISDLKTSIGLNQKFLFMNDLFKGENAAYNEAVEKLNSFSSLEDAKNYLLQLGTAHNWNHDSESANQFTELIERRYT